MMPDWDAMLERAIESHHNGRLDEASDLYRQLISARPNDPETAAIFNNLGQIHKGRGDFAQAIACYRRAITVAPDYADAHSNLGNALVGTGEIEEAIAAYRRALTVDPDHLLARYNLATNLIVGGPPRAALEEAAALFQSVIAAHPAFADAHNNLGWCWLELGQARMARQCFEHAIALKPDHADAYTNLGRVLMEVGDRQGAEAAFRRAIAIRPSALALTNLGTVLRGAGRIEEAKMWHEKALEAEPDNGEALAGLVYACLNLCDWPTAQRAGAALDRVTQAFLARGRRPPEPPFLNIVRRADPPLNRAVAEAWSRGVTPSRPSVAPRTNTGRITVAYVSSDFGKHVVGQIMSAILSRHDRDRFRILGISHGPDDGSEERRALASACDLFVDVREAEPESVAQRLRAESVDVLVDLNGYTHGRRLAIAAQRPAPVQVVHCYAGPVGGGIFDYIVTDRISVPESDLAHFAEQPIYLPHSYLPGERRPAPSAGAKEAAKVAEGLPAKAFVLCSFNQPYKLDAETFAAWSRLLARRDDAVLWLAPMPGVAADALRNAAAAGGVPPERLVIARWVPRPDHLVRLGLADIALDTAVYGGHQTTCDVLCAGVPVVARAGRHFASRIAASLVTAAGLPELVTGSLDGYEKAVAELMARPEKLTAIRARLGDAGRPLFEPAAYVRALENGFGQAVERWRNGLPPGPIFAHQ